MLDGSGGAYDAFDHVIRGREPEALVVIDAGLQACHTGAGRLRHDCAILRHLDERVDDQQAIGGEILPVGDSLHTRGIRAVDDGAGPKPVGEADQLDRDGVGNRAEGDGRRGAGPAPARKGDRWGRRVAGTWIRHDHLIDGSITKKRGSLGTGAATTADHNDWGLGVGGAAIVHRN